jgi:hypothetical protein
MAIQSVHDELHVVVQRVAFNGFGLRIHFGREIGLDWEPQMIKHHSLRN